MRRPTARGWRWLSHVLFVVAMASGPIRNARADGAFPDSGQVLLPPGRPNDIILGTNFGLIFTSDGGVTWEWTCETPLLAMGQSYQLGLSARSGTSDRIVASSLWGVVYSDDASCSWAGSSGDITQTVVTDVFVMRATPQRVFAIGVDANLSTGQQMAYASNDGGVTFGPAIFTAPPDGGLLGIEGAASDPQMIYVSMYMAPQHPLLARTHDGGAVWETFDLEPPLGPSFVRIIAVDPTNAQKIFLRVSNAMGDRLVVSTDGGATFATPWAVSGALTAFVQRANGTILAGGLSSDGMAAGARSIDGGMTFAGWPGVPHLRALAERDGLLYAAADNFADRFALAVSSDEGASFRPLLSYNQVTRIKPCVVSSCMSDCRNRADTAFWPPSVCDGPVRDAGGGADREGRDASGAVEGGGKSLDMDATPTGCSCRAAPHGPSPASIQVVALTMVAALATRRAKARQFRPLRRTSRRSRATILPASKG
jgi:hypothetical protein